jgi:hypothetical protein
VAESPVSGTPKPYTKRATGAANAGNEGISGLRVLPRMVVPIMMSDGFFSLLLKGGFHVSARWA